MIVAIDGPAGSGKSTTARAVARRMGFLYLDTGAMFRAVALVFLRAGADPTDAAAADLLEGCEIQVTHDGETMRIALDGEDVSEAIRRPEVGAMASDVAKLAAVRAYLLAEQRRIGHAHAEGGVVLDGRDIGTVVFPEADVKIFMVADPDVRAARRRDELARRGHDAPLQTVREDLLRRDRQDAGRAIAPLRRADDAVELDTSRRSFEEQVQFVIDKIRERQEKAPV